LTEHQVSAIKWTADACSHLVLRLVTHWKHTGSGIAFFTIPFLALAVTRAIVYQNSR